MEMYFAREDHAETIKIFRSGEHLGERHVLARIYLVVGQALALAPSCQGRLTPASEGDYFQRRE